MIHMVFGILIQTRIFFIFSFEELLDRPAFIIIFFTNIILHLWITSSSYTCYQNLSLKYFGDNSRVSGISACGEHYLYFMKKKDYKDKQNL